METHLPRVQDPKMYFSHHNTEFEGRAPRDAASTEQAVENAITTIREILTEERRKTRRNALPELAPHVPVEYLEPVKAKATARRVRLLSRIKSLRPRSLEVKPHQVGWLAAFALVWWQPLPVLIAMFIGFVLVFLGYAIFGPERMTQVRSRLLRWLPRDFAFRPTMPELKLRREPQPDIFEDLPDPFDRIAYKSR
ncbi:hypothetical protein [Roseovarius sp. 217]|jgi:hypothetical protein|uniref:hypothetical protein n=1 Tax=Roseovarius sp. (strain 217) TaxID=314264 RepID=UPI00032618A2|nr:hypothetical protein [Roseovarius sp. 217]